MATGPFSPSRTVNRLHAGGLSALRHAVTDCQGACGRRPRPGYSGGSVSRSRIVVVQGTPRTYRSPRSRNAWRNQVWRPSSSSPVTQLCGTCAPHTHGSLIFTKVLRIYNILYLLTLCHFIYS